MRTIRGVESKGELSAVCDSRLVNTQRSGVARPLAGSSAVGADPGPCCSTENGDDNDISVHWHAERLASSSVFFVSS